jgi:hypothetical protein
MPPLRVYLDSSDYSVLSDPRRSSPDNKSVLQELRLLKNEGLVTIHFSGTLLSEMAPMDPGSADAALRRADLLVELCGRNALLSQDRIFSIELRRAFGTATNVESVYSSVGEWYPEGVSEISPITAIDMSSCINDAIAETGHNRKARRAAKRIILKAGSPRAALKTALVTNARSGSLDEILTKYPMRPEDARVLGRFVVGDATPAQASRAFENSLRDPRWMMLWFEQHHAQLTPFIEWTRSPAEPFIASLLEMADLAVALRRQDAALKTDLTSSLLSSKRWTEQQNLLLAKIAARFCTEFSFESAQPISTSVLEKKCPGLTVAVRSLHSAAWTVTSETPRKPKLSDFPDAMHAVYAPYVDVFRADSFMAPYISKQVAKHGTTTVSKLADLPRKISEALAARK